MPYGRSRSRDTDKSVGPIIIKRHPSIRTSIRTQAPKHPKRRPKSLTLGFKFVNPFTSKGPIIRKSRPHAHVRLTEGVEVDEDSERNPERSEVRHEPMFRPARGDDYIPLPPPIPFAYEDQDPIIEIRAPRGGDRPQVHHHRRPMSGQFSPEPRGHEPERIIERERDRRREADRLVKHERRRRKEAEAEAQRASQAATKQRDRRHVIEDITHQFERHAINERGTRLEAENQARRAAAAAEAAEARARLAERELEKERRERRLVERERTVLERQRQQELEDRAEAEAEARRQRPIGVQIVQHHFPVDRERAALVRQRQQGWDERVETAADAPIQRRRGVQVVQRQFPTDRGAELIREAQEAERRRREEEEGLYPMDREHLRDGFGRRRSISIYEDEDDRLRRRRH